MAAECIRNTAAANILVKTCLGCFQKMTTTAVTTHLFTIGIHAQKYPLGSYYILKLFAFSFLLMLNEAQYYCTNPKKI